jgi:hypothetical protein
VGAVVSIASFQVTREERVTKRKNGCSKYEARKRLKSSQSGMRACRSIIVPHFGRNGNRSKQHRKVVICHARFCSFVLRSAPWGSRTSDAT